jgi:probable rRNA maturation factor
VRVAVSGEAPCDLAPVRAAMRRAARPYRLPAGARVNLAFIPDGEMRALNRRFRKIDRTTDVLSFGEALPPGIKGEAAVRFLRRGSAGAPELGEIAISADQAARQARRGRRPLSSEVAFLAAHGLLHLLGFEDETPRGYREMLRLGHDAASQKAVKR